MQGMDLTGTFKIRKTDMQAEGFDPGKISDPLFYLDAERQTYQPLDAAAFQQISSGEMRF